MLHSSSRYSPGLFGIPDIVLGRQRLGPPDSGLSGRAPRTRLLLEELEVRQLLSFVIKANFNNGMNDNSNIIKDANAATIEATINTAIANYEKAFTDNITVNITFQEGGGLGGSSTFGSNITYTAYLAALTSHATSNNDTTALASLPAGPNNPVNSGTMVRVTTALQRALGFSNAQNPDSTITLNCNSLTGICFDNRVAPLVGPGPYDLMAVVSHEIDEALAGGSALDGQINGGASPAVIEPLDLFRYSAAGTRSYDTSAATTSYFSIDGGKTNLVGFNQYAPDANHKNDFGDWFSNNGAGNGNGTPRVQDSNATPGSKPNLGVELTRLDVLGYTPASLSAPVVTAPAAQTAVEGTSQTFDLGSFTTFSGDPGPFEVDVSWGDGSSDTTLFVASAGTIPSQSHAYAEEGSYTPKVTVTDFLSLSGSAGSKITVSDPPVVATGGFTFTAVEGSLSTNQTVATFSDPGGIEPVGDYSATIFWGDPNNSQSIVTPVLIGGVLTVQGSHLYGEEGTYTIRVVVHHDGAPDSNLVTSTADVSDPAVLGTPVPFFAVACPTMPVTAPIATFTDPGGAEPNSFDPTPGILNHYTVVSINWGDNTPLDTTTATIKYTGTPGSTTDPFTVSGKHAYAEDGTYTITTTINHEGIITVVKSTANIKDDFGVLLLDPTGLQSLSVTSNLTANGCGAVVVDSNNATAAYLTNGASLTAYDFDVTGGLQVTGSPHIAATIEHEAATPDPLGLPLPAAPAPTFGAVNYSSSLPLTLSPGTYVGGITLNGSGVVTLLPGEYYMKGGGFRINGVNPVTGNGVVIINAPAGPNDLLSITRLTHGEGTISLTAPTSGPFQGIVMLQDPHSSNPVTFSGPGLVTLTGVVYVPRAPVMVRDLESVTINPGAGTATLPPILGAIIGYDLRVGGGAYLIVNPDDPAGGGAASPSGAGNTPLGPLHVAAPPAVVLSGTPQTTVAAAASRPTVPPQAALDQWFSRNLSGTEATGSAPSPLANWLDPLNGPLVDALVSSLAPAP
jgi:hypothetical protein